MPNQKILLIDDDTELCALLSEYLADEGFHLQTVHDGRQGLSEALAHDFDLVILDVMLPGCNGFEVLRGIRRQSNLPVLMLTARGEDVDRIVGLEIGADDYLGKPFNPRELVARMRAILRRTLPPEEDRSPTAEEACLRVDDLEMDTRARRVMVRDNPLELTAVEFTLLKVLLRHAGEVVSRETLNETVLGRAYSPYDRSIDVHVSNLRKKLDSQAGKTDCLKSVRGEGYLYVGGSSMSKS